jgi:hypothetical protein
MSDSDHGIYLQRIDAPPSVVRGASPHTISLTPLGQVYVLHVHMTTQCSAEILLHPGGHAPWPHLLRLREQLDDLLSFPQLAGGAGGRWPRSVPYFSGLPFL